MRWWKENAPADSVVRIYYKHSLLPPSAGSESVPHLCQHPSTNRERHQNNLLCLQKRHAVRMAPYLDFLASEFIKQCEHQWLAAQHPWPYVFLEWILIDPLLELAQKSTGRKCTELWMDYSRVGENMRVKGIYPSYPKLANLISI